MEGAGFQVEDPNYAEYIYTEVNIRNRSDVLDIINGILRI